MTDILTSRPIRVLSSPERAYIPLPLSQANYVHEVLVKNRVSHWVTENATSLNGGPYMTTIYMARGIEAKVVQDLLDSVA